MGKRNFYAHQSAFVDEPCHIGAGTKVWHFSHIMPGARIGANCSIGQNVFIAANTVIGDRAKVQNNVSIYEGVILEEDVFLGPSMVFTNVINPRSHVNRRDEYQTTLVKRGSTIGANATIVCGITLGEYAFIGAGAVVTRDVPPYALVYGTPAKIQGWMCQCGIRLHFTDHEEGEYAICESCRARYNKTGDVVMREG